MLLLCYLSYRRKNVDVALVIMVQGCFIKVEWKMGPINKSEKENHASSTIKFYRERKTQLQIIFCFLLRERDWNGENDNLCDGKVEGSATDD